MKSLPPIFFNTKHVTMVGPMGPNLPDWLLVHPVLAVDGGANHTARMDFWVGDGDSFGKKPACDHQLYPVEKDLSDFGLALEKLGHLNIEELHLWGFLGGRLDHQLFNLGEISQALESGLKSISIFYDFDGKISIMAYPPGEHHLALNRRFSLMTTVPSQITLLGSCQYPIPEPITLSPLSSRGLSNLGFGRQKLSCDKPIFIILDRPGV